MTEKEFLNSISYSNDELDKIKYFLKYRGIDEHDKVRRYLKNFKSEKIKYSEIATAFRYDKRIRRVLFKYIGFLEEYIRAYITNKYSNNINGFKHIDKIKDYLKENDLSSSLSNLTFRQLMEQLFLLDKKDKLEIFNNHFIKKDLLAIVKLRNEICHNRFILDKKEFSCSISKDCSLLENIKNLMNYLSNEMKNNFIKEVNDCAKKRKNKYKEETTWDLMPEIVLEKLRN